MVLTLEAGSSIILLHNSELFVVQRARSSAAERSAHNRLVVGSNPAEPTSSVS